MSKDQLPHEGISGSGAGSKPALGGDGALMQSIGNDGLGHVVPSPASGNASQPGDVMPGSPGGESTVPAPPAAPEFAGPGGPEGV